MEVAGVAPNAKEFVSVELWCPFYFFFIFFFLSYVGIENDVLRLSFMPPNAKAPGGPIGLSASRPCDDSPSWLELNNDSLGSKGATPYFYHFSLSESSAQAKLHS